MFSKHYRSDKDTLSLIGQLFLVYGLWLLICGFTRFPRLTSMSDFY